MTPCDLRILRLRLALAREYERIAGRKSPRARYWKKVVKDLEMCHYVITGKRV